MRTDETQRERERIFVKRKKKKFKIGHKPFYSQLNDKWYLVFLPFFIIYFGVKWFTSDFEWFRLSLKPPTPQVSVWNKPPPPGG